MDRLPEEKARIIQKAARQAQDAQQAAEENGETRGPPDRYSIEYDANNRPFVTVDNDILLGVPQNEWVATVKKVLSSKFPDGIKVGSQEIKINRQSRNEMTFSEYTKWLRNNDKSLYADKLRTANNADEIILASRDYINEGLRHERKDNIRDFARGSVLLRIGQSDYSADVIVGTTTNGSMLLYDIVNMTPAQINGKSSRVVQPNSKEGYRSDAAAPDTSIRSPEPKSQGKFSTDDTTATPQENDKAALTYFGRTYKWSETGYVLLNGARLDFSGRHEGGSGGYRSARLGIQAEIRGCEKLQRDRKIRLKSEDFSRICNSETL